MNIFVYMSDKELYNFGLISFIFVVLLLIICIIFFYINKTKLDAVLKEEYGEKEATIKGNNKKLLEHIFRNNR